MSLKITTLIENMPDEEGKLIFEHGFSAWIEVDGKKILFDTGQTGDFAKNADAMGIDLSEADAVILSHGHYDHTGGLWALLSRLKKKTKFYIGEDFFVPKFKLVEDGSFKFNGNPFEEGLLTQNQRAEVIEIREDVTQITEDLYLFKNFRRRTVYETVNPKFYKKTEAGYEQDLFADEIALGIRKNDGLVLVAGCSHVGIINMLEHVKETTNLRVHTILGGTHLVEADEKRLKQTVKALRQNEVKTVAVSHCTGDAGMELLQREFLDNYIRNNTGNVLFENTHKNYCKF